MKSLTVTVSVTKDPVAPLPVTYPVEKISPVGWNVDDSLLLNFPLFTCEKKMLLLSAILRK